MKKVRPMIEALTHQEMLAKIASGEKKFAAKDWRIRKALNWHTKAKSAVRHLLAGEQTFSPQEERDVEAGFLRFCAGLIKAHHEEDQKLLATIQTSITCLQNIDPDFHEPALRALGELADCLGGVAGQARAKAEGVGD